VLRKIDEMQLLPPSMQDSVLGSSWRWRARAATFPKSTRAAAVGPGQRPVHPRLVTALPLDRHANGISAFRRIEKAARARADFMM
jgi:hypothetical protein